MRIFFLLSVALLFFVTSVGKAQDNPPELPVLSATKGHGCYVSAVAFSKEGNRAASSDMKGNIFLWEVASELKRKAEFRATTGPGVEKWVWSVALSPDGKILAAGSDDKTVWVWESESGKLLRRVRGHGERVDNVFFFPDGKKGISVDRYGTCLVWDVDGDAKPQEQLLKTGARVTSLSPDGKLLCFSDGNNTILFDLANGKKVSTIGKYCEDVAFAPDSKKIAKGDDSFPKTVQLWDTKTGKQLWASNGHNNKIKRVLFTPEGKRILSRDGVRLHIWDTENGDEIGRFRIGGKTVASCIACSLDGKMVLVGNREGGLALHKLPE